VTEVPEEVERLVRQEEQTQAALDRVTAPPVGEPEPESQSGAQALVARMAEERRQEGERERRVNRVSHQHPSPDVEDPLRDFAERQKAGRRRARHRGRWPR
jgi:hypothetical protein